MGTATIRVRASVQGLRGFRFEAGRAILLVSLALLLPAIAGAAPITYGFSSGTVTLRASLENSTTSVLSGPNPVELLLGGTSVTFDPAAGAFGTLTGLVLVPTATINLDLDETLVALDSVSIDSASLTNQIGATGVLNLFGQFELATVLSGIVSGFLPNPSGPPIPFGPELASSLSSAAAGLLEVSGDTVTLGLTGVNIATFAQFPIEANLPNVVVKADFTFIGIVPEPGTALLVGLGLGGLATIRQRERKLR